MRTVHASLLLLAQPVSAKQHVVDAAHFHWSALLKTRPTDPSGPLPLPASTSDNCTSHQEDQWKCLCQMTTRDLSYLPPESGSTTIPAAYGTADAGSAVYRASAETASRASSGGVASELCMDGKAFNPLEAAGEPCRPHLPIFRLFPPAPAPLPQAGPPPEALVREWLGNVRPWRWDCDPHLNQETTGGVGTVRHSFPYAATNPMRAVDCIRGDPPGRTVGLPVIEEEYLELADGLLAVASADIGGTYVVVEIGARNAPWAVRLLKAARLLGRSSHVRAVVMDPMPQHTAWAKQNFEMNGFDGSHYTIVQDMFYPHRMNLHRALAGLDHVDFLDMDAQAGEDFLIRTAEDETALAKVRRLHIESHHPRISRKLIPLLKRHGFRILRTSQNLSASEEECPGCMVSPQLGKLVFRADHIYAVNKRSPNTLYGMC